MTLALALEDFNLATPLPATGPLLPSDDWLAGHLAGLEEGRAAAVQGRAHLSEALVQRLADLEFGYAEARAATLAALGPLFTALIDGFLPDLAAQAFIPRIRAMLDAAAAADLGEPLVLSVAPTEVVAVTDALGALPGRTFTCRSDPALEEGQARLRHGDGGTALDLAALLSESRAILSTLFTDTAETRFAQ